MSGSIPQSFIHDLLNRVDLVGLIGERITLKKSGKNHLACCPFHDDRSPSFSVSSERQRYHCFGCGAKGDAIDFLVNHDRLDFRQAVEELAHRVGVDIPSEARGSEGIIEPKTPLYNLLADAALWYQQALKEHPKRQLAIDYLKGRGLSGAIARDFALGFAPPGWDHLIQALGTDNDQQRLMLDAGLILENAETGRRYDRFRDRIVFPIRDQRGRVIAFGGRVLGDDKPKYLNSPESPVFHKGHELYGLYEARRFNRDLTEIMVVEGYMDVIALAQQGLRNAVAVLGTATTGKHIQCLFRTVPNILFCFDGDAAGREAAWRALEAALPHLEDGRRVRFLFLPEGEDPDSLVRQEGVEVFLARIQQQAQTLVEYCFKKLAEDVDLSLPEDRARYQKLLTPLIEQVPGPYLQELMRQRLTELTGLSAPSKSDISGSTSAPAPSNPVSVAELTNAADRQSSTSVVTSKAGYASKKTDSPIRIALCTLLYRPELAQRVGAIDCLEDLDTDPDTQLLSQLLRWLGSTPHLKPVQLLARCHGTEQGHHLISLLEQEWLIAEDNLEQQFFDTINNLIVRQHERSLDALLRKARETELGIEEKDRLRHLCHLVQRSASEGSATASGANREL
ncbi:DNA primase [Azomonas agilis]|uniref:DNA primase n=1 Tax=Azomonas agilis TaxID=116849 RepID=A0A562I064_9GAMM|nr:DNA primase [Azomonas agilis]TWH64449.1 DNA primase [Azomonas agilis]